MPLKKKKKKILLLSSKYKIEHLIENPDGSLRPLRPGDLDIDKNRGVREAFKLLYEWQKTKYLESKRKEISKDTNGEVYKD
jgi:hypothetical protein